MQKRDVLNSPKLLELKAKRRNIFIKKVFIFLFGIFIILAILSFLSSIKQISIQSVEVSGNKIVETKDIQSLVQDKINGRYFFLFSKKNVLFYPKVEISEALSTEFKRLVSVEPTIKDGNVLEIKVRERTPLYTWCGKDLPVNQQVEECYFLDNEGYIFDEAPYFSGQVYFKFYGQIEGGSPIGSYIKKAEFPKLILFKELVESFKLKPKALFVDATDDAILLLPKGKASSEDPKILFKVDSHLEKTAENLHAALGAEPLKTKMQNFYSYLLYIDLRFDNKVYSKFSND